MRCVFLLSPSAVPGGAERAFANLAAALPSLGWQPTAVLLEEGPLEDWLVGAGCASAVIAASRTRYLHRTAVTLERLRRAMRRVGAEVVVSNQSKGHVIGGAAALAARIPAIWWQQGVASESAIERVAARVPAAAVVCSSEWTAAEQRRLTPCRRVVKVPLGTDVERIAAYCGSGGRLRASLGWDGRTVVGIVGRLERWKRQDTFLRAAASVAPSYPDVRFAVVGGAVLGWEGTYEHDLKELATRLGIADKVTFAGHRSDVWEWVDALDIVVHASAGEPFGLVVVEAMALGKAVVAAADGGPVEVIEEGVSGLLSPVGDHERLADALHRLLLDPGLVTSLGAAAAERAMVFSTDAMAARFAAVMGDVAPAVAGTERTGIVAV